MRIDGSIVVGRTFDGSSILLKQKEQEGLSEGEKEQLKRLKERDQEVRAHESAHKAAAGSSVVQGPSFTHQVGPDGKPYAIGGEVKIALRGDSSNPEKAAAEAERLRAAALAPAESSSQDAAVAGAAAQISAEAAAQIREKNRINFLA
jgi:hypothetical protein